MTTLLAIKIILICLGCVYIVRGFVNVFIATVSCLNAIINEKHWNFSFTGGWIWQIGLSIASVIVGIIL